MPQMAPMWWTIMFLMFTMSFISILMILHFQNYYNPKSEGKDMKPTPKMNWKW